MRVVTIAIEIEDSLADHIVASGEMEWGQVPAKSDEAHLADFASTLKATRETREATGVSGDMPLEGMYYKGTEIIGAITGTSPNSGPRARLLVGLWNSLLAGVQVTENSKPAPPAPPEKTHVCPSRLADGRATGANDDHWVDGLTCSYCGSVSPAAFFAAVESGAEVLPTDKSYKAYIDVADPNVGKPRAHTISTFPSPGSVEEAPGRHVHYGPTPANRHAKFYFEHLSIDERRRFVDMVNQGKMKIGHPGRFYRPPFFMGPA